MPSDPLLSVRGEAVLEVEPEIARVEVSVAAVGADRADTLRQLRERVAAVEKILNSFPGAIDRTEVSGARVGPRLGRGQRDGDGGYHGAVHHVLTVSGFDQLGELMAQLSDQDLTEVGGPWWELRPDSPVHRAARVAATRDAVRRGRDYAAALGSDLAGLVELADTRMLAEPRGQAEPRAGIAAARLPQRSRSGVPEPAFELVPARQLVRASVEARFTITEPDLAALSAD
jgi:uncharacterized protein YggE